MNTLDELRQFMLRRLGNVANIFNWTDYSSNGPLSEYAVDVLLEYGVDDILDATDLAKLRAIATYYAWKAALDNASTVYDFEADEGKYKRSQLFSQINKRLDSAADDMAKHFPVLLPTVYIYDTPRPI